MPGGCFPLGPTATLGRNPANGVVVYYSLKAKPATDVDLEFFDSARKSIRKFTAKMRKPGEAAAPSAPAGPPPGEGGGFGGGAPPPVPTEVGLNRFVWATRYADAVRFSGMILLGGHNAVAQAQ